MNKEIRKVKWISINVLESVAYYSRFNPLYSHLVLKKRPKHSKIFGTSLNKSVTFFFKIAQACSIGFKSGDKVVEVRKSVYLECKVHPRCSWDEN